MDFLSAFRVVLRRWYIVLVALLVSGLIAYVVVKSIEPTYEAKGSALLVGAPAPVTDPLQPETNNQNPFTRLDASTATLTAVATQIMDDGPTREDLIAQGASKDYEVGQATDGTPVFVVVATDTDPDVAVSTAQLVLDRLSKELDERQAEAGAPADARVRAITITDPTEASQLIGGKVRAFLAVVALGGAASLSLAFVADAIAQSRKRRNEAQSSATVGDADDRGDPRLAAPGPGVPPRPAAAPEATMGGSDADAPDAPAVAPAVAPAPAPDDAATTLLRKSS